MQRRCDGELVLEEDPMASFLTCCISIHGKGPKRTNVFLATCYPPTTDGRVEYELHVGSVFGLASRCSENG